MAGGSSGQPFSSDNIIMCVPTLSSPGGGHMLGQRHQDRELTRRDMTGGATELQTLRTNGHSPCGNRETSAVPCGGRYQWDGDRWDGWRGQPQGGEIRKPRASEAKPWVHRPQFRQSPNGARFRFARYIDEPQEARLFGPYAHSFPYTQGCALGCRISPRWAFRKTKKGTDPFNEHVGVGRAGGSEVAY